jgi:adenylosuccinate lyase
MGTRVTDSALYAQLWGTAELGEVFEERSRIRSWVQILVALAEAQAGLRIIPDTAARDLAAAAARESLDLDLDLAARETRRIGHSTLGVIAALGRVLPQGMVAEHERDGRSWKAEWPALSETCLLTGASLSLAKGLLAGIRGSPWPRRWKAFPWTPP